MKNRESILPLVAALIVMGFALWKPDLAIGVAVASLILLSIYYSFAKKSESAEQKEEMKAPATPAPEQK